MERERRILQRLQKHREKLLQDSTVDDEALKDVQFAIEDSQKRLEAMVTTNTTTMSASIPSASVRTTSSDFVSFSSFDYTVLTREIEQIEFDYLGRGGVDPFVLKQIYTLQEEIKHLIDFEKTFGDRISKPTYPQEQIEDEDSAKLRLGHRKKMLELQAQKEELLLRKDIEELKRLVPSTKEDNEHFHLLLSIVMLTLVSRVDFKDCDVEITFGLVIDGSEIDTETIYRSNPSVEDNDVHFAFDFIKKLRIPSTPKSKLVFEVCIINGDARILTWTFLDLHVKELWTDFGSWKLPLFKPPIIRASQDLRRLARMEDAFLFVLLAPCKDDVPKSISFNPGQFIEKYTVDKAIQTPLNNAKKSSVNKIEAIKSTVSLFQANADEEKVKPVSPMRSQNLPFSDRPKSMDASSIKSRNSQRLDSIPALGSTVFQVQPQSIKASLAAVSEPINIKVCFLNITDLFCHCAFMSIKLVEDETIKEFPDMAIPMNKHTFTFMNEISVEIKVIPFQTTYLQIEIFDEANDAVAWTRIYLFDQSPKIPPELSEGVRQLILFSPPSDSAKPNPIGQATLRAKCEDLSRPKTSSVAKLNIPEEAWREKIQVYDVNSFEDSAGFSIHIDGARFLPPNILFSRVHCRLFDHLFNPIPDCPKLITKFNLESLITSPQFGASLEFPSHWLSKTTTMVFKVFGMEQKTRKVRYIGFSLLNLYIDADTLQQPEPDSNGSVHLHLGNFQLPIFSGSVDIYDDLTIHTISKYTRIPCATILVRIQSSLNADLTIPTYESGVYDSSRCIPNEKEAEIYRDLLNTCESKNYSEVLKEFGLDPKDEFACLKYLNDTFNWEDKPQPLDISCLVKYNQKYGIKVSLDAAQNLPGKRIVVGIVSVCPPAVLYDPHTGIPVGPKNTRFTTKIEFTSSLKSPQFNDGFWTFRPELSQNCMAIIELRSFNLKRESREHLEELGWTAIPLFQNNEYVMHGCFQLPLYQGSITRAMILQLQTRNPWTVLSEFVKEDQVRPLEGSSIFVRIADARRDTEVSFSREQANTKFLPENSKKKLYFVVRTTDSVETLVPPKVSKTKFLAYIASEVRAQLRI